MCKRIAVFLFCFFSVFLASLVCQEVRYLPISEAELSRLQELSEKQEQALTQASTRLSLLQGQSATLQKQVTTLQTLSANLLSSLEVSKAAIARSTKLYVEYVRGASSIIEEDRKKIARLEMWRTVALVLAFIIAAYIAVKIFFKKLKIP